VNTLPDFSHLGKRGRILSNLIPSKIIDLETAKLKLALLKENFDYQRFYERFRKDPDAYISVSPNPNKPDEHSDRPARAAPLFTRAQVTDKQLRYHATLYGMNPMIEIILWAIGWPFDEFMALLDPEKDVSEIGNEDLLLVLPLFFSSKGIRRCLPGYNKQFYYGADFMEARHRSDVWTKLEPYEHVLIVDLRKHKAVLQEEFGEFVKQEQSYHKKISGRVSPYVSDNTYSMWEPDGRERKEAQDQLEVWKLRKQFYSFPSISMELGISEDLAKKRFYRAYELTQGEPYDRERFKRKLDSLPPVKACDRCPDRDGCTELCPPMMAMLKHYEGSAREISFSDYEAQTGVDLLSKKPRT